MPKVKPFNAKDKAEKEIEYWKMHLETMDKTNIEITNSKYLGLFSILSGAFVGFLIGVLTIDFNNFEGLQIIMGGVVIALFIYIFSKYGTDFKKKIKSHEDSLFIRERMLRERYETLYGVDKHKLNTEFEDLKGIIKNPRVAMVEFLIREYYKRKS